MKEINTTDAVVGELAKRITSGQWAIGAKLPSEKELCQEYGVSRTTLREAIGMIRAMGYIETRHGSGSYIIATSVSNSENIKQWFALRKTELNDFFEVRSSSEVLCIRYAILRRTDEDIEALKSIHNALENATLRGDAVKMALLDEKFHTQLAVISRNSLLMGFDQIIAKSLRSYRLNSFAVPENAVHALIPHLQIIKALEDRNLVAGVEAVQSHIDRSLEDIAAVSENFAQGEDDTPEA